MPINTINGDSGSATGAAITITGSTSGAVFTASGSTITESFNYLALPTTTSVNGQITINSSPYFHGYGTDNVFAGKSAGNFTLTGTQNVGIGSNVMALATTAGNNVFVGYNSASAGIVSGTGNNVAVGFQAMLSLTSATNCVAVGFNALADNLTGANNTCVGSTAGQHVTGNDNTAIGNGALAHTGNTGTNNTCVGSSALSALAGAGSYNSCFGFQAGNAYTTTESSNILINNTGTAGDSNVCRVGASTGTGTQQLNKTFIHGIRGITTVNADAVAVLVDSVGQLGTVSSSIRYKENVEDMGDVSSPVMNLRPVTFDFIGKPSHKKQVGLIAEEVYEIMPDLVVHNMDGDIESVKYHELPVLLLNELQKVLKRIEVLEAKVSDK